MQICRNNFRNQEKKIKRRKEVESHYYKVISLIRTAENFKALELNPLCKVYGFEALTGDLSGYYSFNLEKSRGKIRLIFSCAEEEEIIILEYISMDHYKDFKRRK